MEEHTFGTFSTDALKLTYERARARGIHHLARTIPPDPQPGEPFTLVVTTGADLPAEEIALFYTTNGAAPDEHSERAAFEPVQREWHIPAWGYVTTWHARIPALSDDTLLRYRIAWRTHGEVWQWAQSLNPQRHVEAELTEIHGVPAAPLPAAEVEFARSIDSFAPPAWAQEATIYQIFLDRFARCDDVAWDPDKPLNTFHGGSLRGVIEKLPYIAELGMTCIWLSPLFPSPTYHGYDATDYYDIEARFGTKADLKALVERAHALGIRVILDFICNHLSDQHPRFQEALAEPHSPARDWFYFEDGSNASPYRAFFGVRTMPELNTDLPAVSTYLIDAAVMWLRDFDVDGFRLDYAHGPSHAFWAHFRRAVKRAKADAWCFGEVIDTPDAMRAYTGYLDGVLDFHLGDALRQVFALHTRDLTWLAYFMRDHEAFFPAHDRLSRPAFLDNHDMERFTYRAQGDGEAALRLASLFLYTLPNQPLLYYGTEIGLEQRFSKAEHGLEVAREPMPWERTAAAPPLLAYFQRLGALRRAEPAMRPDRRETLLAAQDEYLARLRRDESTLLLALNRAPTATTIHHESLRGTFIDKVTGAIIELDGGLTLPPVQGLLLEASTL